MASRSCTTLQLTRYAAIVLATFLLPMAAWASSSSFNSASSTCLPGVAICVFNQSGTATGGSAGLTMSGKNASTVVQIGGDQGANLGTLSLTTGALISGTLSGGGTFAPGTLTITTTGWNGFNGTLFSGTFGSLTDPIQWIALGKVGGFYQYELVGAISGSWENTVSVSGETAQLYFHSKTPYNGESISLASGTTGIVVPEQATVGLMGTGLIALGLLVRRKAKKN